MERVTILTTIDQTLVDRLPELKPLTGEQVEIVIRDPAKVPGRRRGGWAKGKIHMSDDFDAPLEEFKDYM